MAGFNWIVKLIATHQIEINGHCLNVTHLNFAYIKYIYAWYVRVFWILDRIDFSSSPLEFSSQTTYLTMYAKLIRLIWHVIQSLANRYNNKVYILFGFWRDDDDKDGERSLFEILNTINHSLNNFRRFLVTFLWVLNNLNFFFEWGNSCMFFTSSFFLLVCLMTMTSSKRIGWSALLSSLSIPT